jgi:hypothetical protein
VRQRTGIEQNFDNLNVIVTNGLDEGRDAGMVCESRNHVSQCAHALNLEVLYHTFDLDFYGRRVLKQLYHLSNIAHCARFVECRHHFASRFRFRFKVQQLQRRSQGGRAITAVNRTASLQRVL